jgi:hypothetical protein
MKQTELIQLARKELPQLEAIIGLNAAKGTDIKTLALQELEYLQMIGTTKPEIYECMPVSIISAIKTVLKQNLTLDPYAGLVYVKTRNVKMNNEWAKVLEIQPSANGIISINRQCGRVFDIERPEVLKNDKGKVTGVKLRYLVPSYNEAGKPCYKWREVEFDESDFLRWRRASHKENGRNKADANAETLNYANPNYTSWNGGIDPEFARAKAIRHGLKKLGTNQNERAQVTGERLIVDIDQAADEAAHEDEYISHDEAPPVTNNHNHINISLEELPSDEPVEELEL